MLIGTTSNQVTWGAGFTCFRVSLAKHCLMEYNGFRYDARNDLTNVTNAIKNIGPV